MSYRHGAEVPEPEFFIEIFLQPGDFYWSDAETRLRTLLGSCVAICLWHPEKRIGGMCHFMLPKKKFGHMLGELDGRYANDVMQLFINEMKKTKTRPTEYIAKVFGGGDMFANLASNKSGDKERILIGDKNIQAAHDILHKLHIPVAGESVGEKSYRKIVFDLWSGVVLVKKTESAPSWVDVDLPDGGVIE